MITIMILSEYSQLYLPVLSGFILLGLLFQGCATRKATFPGTPWDTYPQPKEAGFNEQKLEELSQWVKKNTPATGVVAAYKGKLLYSYGDIKKVSYIASCRKSILAMLYGKYVENGVVNLEETIGDLGITEKGGLLPIEKKATVDDIITARSGVFHEASNGGYDKKSFLERGAVEPGTYWVYNNWDFNVGGHIFEQYAGKSIYKEIEEQFAIPLGFQDWNIKNQRKSGNTKKSQYKAYHMYFSTRDMAKLGQLMLQKGKWGGKQILSEEWVAKTTTRVTPHSVLEDRYGETAEGDPVFSYSYMWWLIDDYRGMPEFEGAYAALGYGGQYILILPAIDMVVAVKTKLNLPTLLGITYKETSGKDLFRITRELIEARE